MEITRTLLIIVLAATVAGCVNQEPLPADPLEVATSGPPPQTDAGVSAVPGSSAEPPSAPTLGRDDVDWLRGKTVAASGRYLVTRIPEGFELVDDYRAGPNGDGREVRILQFAQTSDAPDQVAAFFDVGFIRGHDPEREAARFERLLATDASDTLAFADRQAVVYPSASGARTIRWIGRSGAVVYVSGVGLSERALRFVAEGIRRAEPADATTGSSS